MQLFTFSYTTFKIPGSPLFCQDSKGAYGLAGLFFGNAVDSHGHLVTFFAITSKWKRNFISKAVSGMEGQYKVLWKKHWEGRNYENSGNTRLCVSVISFELLLIHSLMKLLIINNPIWGPSLLGLYAEQQLVQLTYLAL